MRLDLEDEYESDIQQYLGALTNDIELDDNEKLIAICILERHNDEGERTMISAFLGGTAVVVAAIAVAASVPNIHWLIRVVLTLILVVLIGVMFLVPHLNKYRNNEAAPKEATVAIVQHRRDLGFFEPRPHFDELDDSPESNVSDSGVAIMLLVLAGLFTFRAFRNR